MMNVLRLGEINQVCLIGMVNLINKLRERLLRNYLHFDVSPILNSQMDDETKSALCEFRFEREFQIHL